MPAGKSTSPSYSKIKETGERSQRTNGGRRSTGKTEERRRQREENDKKVEEILDLMVNKRGQAPESILSMWFKCLSTKDDYDVVTDVMEQHRFTVCKKDELLARSQGLGILLQGEEKLRQEEEDKVRDAGKVVTRLRKDLAAANVRVSLIPRD